MTLTINELAPGMNVLMRMHFRTYATIRDKWQLMLRAAAGTTRFTEPCDVWIVRHYASQPLDPDNRYASAKVILDGLVRSGILPNDNDKCISSLVVEQVKVSTRKEERTEITIATRKAA
jgi:hypothetical protein